MFAYCLAAGRFGVGRFGVGRFIAGLAALSVLVSPPPVSAQAAGPRVDEPDIAAALHAYFDPLAETRDLSGVVRVERGEKVTEAWFGYAEWETHAPITSATRFAVGSIAKSMVATVVLILVERGRIDLHEPVATYLPEYRYGDRMTLEQVLHHRSGIARDVPDSTRATFGPGGLVEWLNTREPEPNVDGSPAYSNVAYDLLALVSERVGGRPYEALVDSLIFRPLGMSESFLVSHTVHAAAARPHVPGPPPTEIRAAPDDHSVSGLLFATPADLARWGRAVRDAEVVDLRQPDGTLAGSVSTRTIAGRPALWMQGSISGGGAVVVTFPEEDVVVVVALNLGSYPLFESETVVSAIAHDIDPGTPPERLPAVALTDEHRELTGHYDLPGVGHIRIHEVKGEMQVTVVGPGWDYYLTPAHGGRLVWRTFNFTFAARRDAEGHVDGLNVRLHMVGQDGPGDSQVDRRSDVQSGGSME